VSAGVWIGVALVGGVGAIARFAGDAAVERHVSPSFPLGTLAVNLVGSLALGGLAGAGVAGDALALAGTAFLGSFTTFSTLALETQRLAEDGELGYALANALGSLAAGFAAAALGWAIGAAA
jgi:fluoride exporter